MFTAIEVLNACEVPDAKTVHRFGPRKEKGEIFDESRF